MLAIERSVCNKLPFVTTIATWLWIVVVDGGVGGGVAGAATVVIAVSAILLINWFG